MEMDWCLYTIHPHTYISSPATYRLFPNGTTSSHTTTSPSLSNTHTRPISLLSNGAGPLRMTTRPLRISGHYPQGNASGPWGQLAAHSLRLSPHICQKQVRTAPCVSPLSLFITLTIFILCLSSSPSLSAGHFLNIWLKPPSQVRKYFFFQGAFLPSQSDFKGICSSLGGFLLTYELIGLCIGK